MLILDPAKIDQHTQEEAREREMERQALWVKDQLQDAIYVSNDDTSPTNYQRQLGKPLTDKVVEAKLSKLLPYMRFIPHPKVKDKNCMYQLHPNGTLEFIMAYERGIIPERSVMQEQVKETLDPAMLQAGRLHIDRGDLPHHEIKPHEFNADGTLKELGNVNWDDREVRPGMKRTKLPYFEAKRGYRQMFAMLVAMGHLSPEQATQALGTDNRPEWKKAMNKQGVSVW